jgi:DNA-binding response OmpR family regulator
MDIESASRIPKGDNSKFQSRPRILVVDDEKVIRQLLTDCLSNDFEILEAPNGYEALVIITKTLPDLIILDITMLGLSGFQVLRNIRKNSDIPVIMLSARTDPTDKVESFELGADDYISKPFDIEELNARIRAILRRSASKNKATCTVFSDGRLRIELTKRRVSVEGQEIELTPKEFSLLQELFLGAGMVMDYQNLLKTVWGFEYTKDEKESVRAVVKRLRSKIESDPGNPQYVLTVDGIGYRFKDI